MRKYILIILIIVLVALQYRFWGANDGILKMFHLKRGINELQAKNDEIKKCNEYLVHEIDSLKKGGGAIENKARLDLGMIKKGEVFYQVIR